MNDSKLQKLLGICFIDFAYRKQRNFIVLVIKNFVQLFPVNLSVNTSDIICVHLWKIIAIILSVCSSWVMIDAKIQSRSICWGRGFGQTKKSSKWLPKKYFFPLLPPVISILNFYNRKRKKHLRGQTINSGYYFCL